MLIEAQVVDPEKEAQDLAEKLGFNQPVAHAVDVRPEACVFLLSCSSKGKAICFGGFVLLVLLAVVLPIVFVVTKNGKEDVNVFDVSSTLSPWASPLPHDELKSLTTHQAAIVDMHFGEWLEEHADPVAMAEANGAHTVFAPTNQAFLLQDNKFLSPPFVAHLRNQLLHHTTPDD